jgi:hypothetical protein
MHSDLITQTSISSDKLKTPSFKDIYPTKIFSLLLANTVKITLVIQGNSAATGTIWLMNYL